MADHNNIKNRIMISYRREDSTGITGRIYDRLVQKFQKGDVFKDVDSIPLGANFKQHLDTVIGQCGVLLVVIGDKWLDVSDLSGKRRLDDLADVVRIEVVSALQRNIPVIPLLVQGATMPVEDTLPESMKGLAYRNGMTIGDDPHFHDDMDRLIRSLCKILDLPLEHAETLQQTTETSGQHIPTPEGNEKEKESKKYSQAVSQKPGSSILGKQVNRFLYFKDVIKKIGFKGIFAFAIILVVVIQASMKNSDVYHLALIQAQNHGELLQVLGEPISPGWFVSGNLSTNKAGLSFSLSGPKGKGTLYTQAIKKKGLWNLSEAEVAVNGSDQHIDLLTK